MFHDFVLEQNEQYRSYFFIKKNYIDFYILKNSKLKTQGVYSGQGGWIARVVFFFKLNLSDRIYKLVNSRDRLIKKIKLEGQI